MPRTAGERRLLGKRYDPADLDGFHDDLVDAWVITVANGLKTPGLREAHAKCCGDLWGVLR